MHPSEKHSQLHAAEPNSSELHATDMRSFDIRSFENIDFSQVKRNANTFPVIRLDDCAPQLSSSYIVKGLWHRNCLSIIWGESGSRKTFALLAGALAIASGQPHWHNRRIRQSRVVYICAEGGDDDARNRVAAIKNTLPVRDAEFALIPTPVAIDNADALNALTAAIKSTFGEPRADLLIFDTVSVCLHATDEYHNGEVAKMISRLRALMRLLGGAHIALVHHTGHSANRERGAYAWRANADVSVEIAFDERRKTGVLTAHKVRHGASGAIGAFTCQEVDLGVDEDGDRVSTLVAIDCAIPESGKPSPEKALPALAAEFLEEIEIGVARKGRRVCVDPDLPEVLALERSVLNERLRDAGLIGDPDQADAPLSSGDRSRVRDNLEQLRASGLIGRNARYVWLVSKIKASADGN